MFSGLSAGAAETVKGSKAAKSPKKMMKILNGLFGMRFWLCFNEYFFAV